MRAVVLDGNLAREPTGADVEWAISPLNPRAAPAEDAVVAGSFEFLGPTARHQLVAAIGRAVAARDSTHVPQWLVSVPGKPHARLAGWRSVSLMHALGKVFGAALWVVRSGRCGIFRRPSSGSALGVSRLRLPGAS